MGRNIHIQNSHVPTSMVVKLLLLFTILSITACTKELKLPAVETGKKIVLIGEIAGGEQMQLRAGQSLPVSSGNNLKQELPDGLTIQLKSDNGIENLSGVADSMSAGLYTIPFKGTATLQPGATYQLVATHPQLGTATCDFKMPEVFSAVVTDTTAASYAGTSVLRTNIRIDDPITSGNFYMLEVLKQPMTITGSFLYNNQWLNIDTSRTLYDSLKDAGVAFSTSFDTTYSNNYIRQWVYTNDDNSENLAIGNALNATRRILLSDRSFNGQAYNTHIFIDRSQLIASDAFWNTAKGRVIILVKSITEDYFNYLLEYEQSLPGFDLNQPSRVEGNIDNGLGIIGATYKHEFCYIFDSWGF